MKHQKVDKIHTVICLILFFLIPSSYASTFSIRIYQSAPNLDWQTTQPPHRYLLLNIMQGLFRIEKDLSLKKVHVASYEIRNNGKSYVLNLKKNLKWSDGKRITSKDYLRSWRRLQKRKHLGERSVFENILSFNTPNLGTIKVELKTAQPRFLYDLSLAALFPIRAVHLKKKFSPGFPTTGPYQISKWDKKTKTYTLIKNRHFGEPNNGPDTIKILVVPNNEKAKKLFKKDKLSAFIGINTDIISEFRSAKLASFKMWFLDYLEFNLKGDLGKYKKLRTAIRLALSRHEFVQNLNSGQRPGTSLVLEGMIGYSENSLAHSREKSLELMKEWSEKNPFAKNQTFKILYYSTPTSKKMAKSISTQLELLLGIKIKSIFVSIPEYKKALKTKKYDAALRYFNPTTPLSDSVFYRYTSKSPANVSGFKNKDYDKKFKALTESPIKGRKSLYKELNQTLIDSESLILPLADNGVTPVLLHRTVKKFFISPLNTIWFPNIELHDK